ncbi:MAG: RNA polymerase subunit sigma-24, partial [Flavobacteriales bacterium]
MQTLTTDIKQLIERCKKKEQSAYYAVYHLYAKSMYNTAYRILNNTGDA